jgi:tricorn protease
LKRLAILTLAAALAAAASTCASAAAAGASQLMRNPDISAEHLVFTYEDDLWLADATGGPARRLTNGPGFENAGKFSPDGRWLAFSADYDGGVDVYVMPVAGGEPRRLTFHSGADQVLDWHPDGRRILFRSSREHPLGQPQLFLVDREGGLPEKVAVDRGALASFSPDGKRLAYNRIAREGATWKRYRGGMAQDVWVADFATGAIAKVTDFEGTDNYPMWWQDRIVFLSDREDGTLNLYAMSPTGADVVRLTNYRDYDVKSPGCGAGRVVYQHAGSLRVLDLATGADREVVLDVGSDRAPMRSELVDAAPSTGSFGLSPAGERLLLEARGEILSLPAEKGEWFDLTRTSASREKNAAWSPDGRWVCFVSDRGGEEQLYLADQRGRDAWRPLTTDNRGFLLQPVWSPDSQRILWGDKYMRLNMVDVATGKVTVIDTGEYDDAWERWGILDYVWSPDGQWVAYSKNTANMNEVICLYGLASGKSTQVTDDFFTSWSPGFDPEGRYLWFLSNRTFTPIMDRQDQNHIFVDMAKPYLVLLQDGVRSPFFEDPGLVTAKADQEKTTDEEKKGGEDAKPAATRVDLDGLGGRVLAVPGVEGGNYFRLTATADGCLMLRRDEPIFLKYQNVDDRTAESDLTLVAYDVAEREAKDLGGGLANYHLSADGKKLAYRAGAAYGVVDAGQEFKPGDGAVDLDGVRLRVDRAQEYRQMLDEAWRIQRDWFYDEGMHGVDWRKIRDKYAALVPWCGARGDLTYLIGEMIAELNIGHTYVYGGDQQHAGAPSRTAMLGCDFAADPRSGRVRIARILPGCVWDAAARSPLAEPGVDVREGDFLLAVDGRPLAAGANPYELLADAAGRTVELEVADNAEGKQPRTVVVEPLRGEGGLRYRTWVEANRRYVDEKSGGRLGYLHLPDMGEPGLVEFGAYWYPQTGREGLVIDERDNGGGFVGDMIIDRLERVLWSMTIPREGGPGRNPERAFHGPLAVLINEDTGSNGEFFAEAVKVRGLATVIGMRTWGGAIGIEPHQDLVDGGTVTPPQFGLHDLHGKWIIEGRGVEPHLEVQNQPAAVVAGRDDQLDRAIGHLLGRLKDEGERWRIPTVPDYPDKSKPGEGVGK